jgi:hypothetical protein
MARREPRHFFARFPASTAGISASPPAIQTATTRAFFLGYHAAMNPPLHVFLELEFLGLVLFSLILPTALYWFLFQRQSISRYSVIALAVLLILMAGIDVVLLQTLAEQSRATPSTLDDKIFTSAMAVALYLFPAIYAGIGVNLLSHILIDHLHRAESRHDKDERGKK